MTTHLLPPKTTMLMAVDAAKDEYCVLKLTRDELRTIHASLVGATYRNSQRSNPSDEDRMKAGLLSEGLRNAFMAAL